MAIKYLTNEDKLIKASDEKKILSALNRIEKACNDITNLGYTIYVSEHGNFNVMNQEEYTNGLDYSQDCIVADISVDKVDGGSW